MATVPRNKVTDKALQEKAGDTAVKKGMDRGDYSAEGMDYFVEQDARNASNDEAAKQSKQDKSRVGAIAKAKGLATSEAAKLDDETFMRASNMGLLKK